MPEQKIESTCAAWDSRALGASEAHVVVASPEYEAALVAAMGSVVFSIQVLYLGQQVVFACDGKCSKAWGVGARPREVLGVVDDYYLLPDSALGEAPARPKTTEGGDCKPSSPLRMNKWCMRQCERSSRFRPGDELVVRDFSKRIYNKPWLHPEAGSHPK